MTQESLILHNPNHEIISFRLDKGVDDHIAKMSRHKQRRLIRCFSYNVALPSRQSVDLVKLSGLTVKEIKESTEYLQMQNHFQVMYDSSLATEEPVEVIEELEDVDPVDADDIDGILLEDKAETLDEIFEEELPGGIEIDGTFYLGDTPQEISGCEPADDTPSEVSKVDKPGEPPEGYKLDPDLQEKRPLSEAEVLRAKSEEIDGPLPNIGASVIGFEEIEPEPEAVEEVKPEPKKKRKPRKKATKKKTAKKGKK